MSDRITVDTSSFRKFALQCRAAEAVVRTRLNRNIAIAAQAAATRSRGKAAFSTRIPSTIRVRPRGLAAYAITAGGSTAPGAAALNNRGMSGTFQHPVFGNQAVQVDQPAHPFMPSRVDVMPAELLAGEKAVRETFAAVGFH